MVIKPVISQTKMSHPALPTFRVISALTIKIPDPIMDPATIMVPSSNPRVGLKVLVVSVIETEDKKILLLLLIGAVQPLHQVSGDIVGSIFTIDKRTWIVGNDIRIVLLLII